MDGTRRALSTLRWTELGRVRMRCLPTESARVIFQPEGRCRSGSGDSAAVSLRVERHCRVRVLRLPTRSDGVVFRPPRLGFAPEHSCAQASRERLAQVQRRPGRPRSCRHQMHCRRRSTRAARRLIDYGSRVGALCCAVPGSTTPSSRRSPKRGEAQRPTTPGPRRDRRRRDIETSGDLR